jgi:nucleoid-associated protein YgaU
MAVTTKKALLFLTGGVAAAAVVAYGAGAFDPLMKRPETIAALPEAGQADQKDARLPTAEPPAAAPAQPPATETTTPAAPEAPAAAAPEGAGKPPVVPPSFDVVRVEGDGSIVIAGKAAPSAAVDLLVGSHVIGSATAGDDGDFAVVLDDPLKPGDYQIVLRATAPDKVVAMSVETAVVSVPETPEGQVLALVEEPGKPSQMITVPQPQAPAAAAKPPEAAPPAAETPPAAEAPAPAEPKPEGEMQAALPEQTAPAPAPATPPPSGPAVRVDAVEIDGRKIFVAGSADPGRTVRAYANEILLGDAKASPDGSYLIEAERDLPVGDYIIRVDALEPDGVKVAARAAVPFEREPGETIAAVAPQAPVAATLPAAPAAQTPAAEAPAPQTPAAAAEAPAPTPQAPAEPPATAQAPAEQPAEAPAATPTVPEQPSPTPEAPAGVAEAPGTETSATDSAAETSAPEAPAAADAGTASGAATPPAAGAPADGTTAEAPAAEAPAAGTSAPETPTSPPAVATAPATEPPPADAPAGGDAPPPAAEPETDIAAAPAEDGALPAPPPAGVDEVLAPKLQSAGGAVIIRRGDSLWRISRRVYGRGVRYSTIYLANQSQIEDPDKMADGEVDADYSTLGDSLTTAPAEGVQ